MKKRILSIILVLCLCLSTFSISVIATENEEITILYTNDVHTYIDGDITYSKLASLKDT